MKQGNTLLARYLLKVAGVLDIVMLCPLCSMTNTGSGWVWLIFILVAINGCIGFYAVSQGIVFELGRERVWKAVCGGLGENFAGTRKVFYSNPLWVFGGPLLRPHEERRYPKLRNVYGTLDSWTGIVTPFAGQTVQNYSDHAESFALAFHVPFVTFGLAENGLISIRAGHVPILDAYDHPAALGIPGRGQTQQLAAPNPPSYEQALLQAVPMAHDLQGRIWYMPILWQHLLIAARTGAGKGSWIWSLVLGLAPAWRAGLVQFYGCDPKKLELALAPHYWERYADSETAIVELLEQCVAEMLERAKQLQGKARKFTPSVETPLKVIVVDELGYLSAMLPDKKLRERAEKAVSTILALGRAVGYSLVGAVQDPRKETVGFRDLFPIRIAGGLPAPMVDLVLGDGMHEAGAYAERIPLGTAGAGVAYVVSETDQKPLLVRAAWCDDDLIRQAVTE